MNYNSKRKKNKAFKFITSALMTLTMLTAFLMQNMTAYAGGSMTGIGDPNAGFLEYGVNDYSWQGYLFWMQSKDNTSGAESPIWFYNFQGSGMSPFTRDESNPLYVADGMPIQNRFGNAASNVCGPGSPYDKIMARPLYGGGTSLKANLLKTNSKGYPNAYVFINAIFGQEMADKWYDGDILLVFEPIFWTYPWADNGNGTHTFYEPFIGTPYYWGKKNIEAKVPRA